jgi:hypothetical protein
VFSIRKSRTEFERVVQHSEKLDRNWKFQPEILKARPHLGLQSDFSQNWRELEKAEQLLAESDGNRNPPANLLNCRPDFWDSGRPFKKAVGF